MHAHAELASLHVDLSLYPFVLAVSSFLCCGAAGDHLYRMNYQDFVLAHRKTGADITVAALPTDEKKATAFGLMKIDGSGRIVDFAEKPKGEALHAMRVDTTILGLDAERYASQSGIQEHRSY